MTEEKPITNRCTKVAYGSKAIANRSIGKVGGYSYWCPYCEIWHIQKPKGWKNNRMENKRKK